ncbi:Hypothetical predicted protein [Mytilus galloprovincialis]|uniref:Uncharacterized protein n=1 Tax=Mytilus galloprovincialis TaxID=29158 RepID=A0A8B6E9S2_MYTGA|nr:Hypothetical predicted protein [Mytilus galloprovincialis]
MLIREYQIGTDGSAVCFMLCTSFRLRRNTQCISSSQCTTAAPCCRVDSGPLGLPSSGTCSGLHGDEGDICYALCGCKSGLTCYRPLTGVCCLPKKCYDSAWLQQQELNFENCMSQANGTQHPSFCFPV